MLLHIMFVIQLCLESYSLFTFYYIHIHSYDAVYVQVYLIIKEFSYCYIWCDGGTTCSAKHISIHVHAPDYYAHRFIIFNGSKTITKKQTIPLLDQYCLKLVLFQPSSD